MLTDNDKIACCKICTLAKKMRTCDTCPFNIGLVHKVLDKIKAEPIDAKGQALLSERRVKVINLLSS